MSTQPLIAPTVQQKPFFANTEDYWTVWVGLTWFGVIIGTTFWGLTSGHIYPWEGRDIITTLDPYNIGGMIIIIAATIATMYVVHLFAHVNKPHAIWQYATICAIVILCKFIGANIHLHNIGLGDSVWCIFAGVLLRFILGFFPDVYAKFKHMYSLEFFIKIGIVLLAINLREIREYGPKGLVVAWVETCILIAGFYYVGTRLLDIDPESAIVTTCGTAICGSSAAVAIGDSVNADKSIIFGLITIMSILTIPLIPVLPIIGNGRKFPTIVTGAWIGGCVDSTGAVSASASLGGIDVLHAAIIIKMLQNVLIGPVALVITGIWHRTYKLSVLWDKFPKFVFGFIITSVITTVLPARIETDLINNTFVVSEWFSSISFVMIGLDIDLWTVGPKILAMKKILLLYLLVQFADIWSTLAISAIMFVWI